MSGDQIPGMAHDPAATTAPVTAPNADQDAAESSGPARLAPYKIFTVPEGLRHLDAGQLAQFEASFRAWVDGARRADARRARERTRLLFLLLRYTGARLSEVVGPGDLTYLDLEGGRAVFGANGAQRQVPLSRMLCRELRLFLDGPMGAGLCGNVFTADPGYVRRVFHARAEACGLPRGLGTPRVLRTSRAVELLRSGVPLAVVRDVLGQSSASLSTVYQAYSSEDSQHIVRRLAPDDLPLRTSARNSFPCRVEEVRCDGVLAEVRLRTYAGASLHALITVESSQNLGLAPGVPVVATIKAPLVDVGQADGGRGCVRNSLAAVITEVRSNEVVAEVMGEAADGMPLCALVSAAALRDSGVGEGDLVQFRFKALSVVLGAL